MRTVATRQGDDVSDVLERLVEYKRAVSGLFPALPRELEELVFLKGGDALGIWALLDRLGEGIEVVEVGTFFGASAFVFASHPNVSRITGIDPDPTLAKVEVAGVHEGLPEDISVLEVARRVLSCFSEGEKVELLAGTTETVPVPCCDLAFIDGAHTRGWVRRDLEAVLERSPGALALLHDCALPPHGPEVRAGVLDFLTASPGRRFRRLSMVGGEVASEAGDEDEDAGTRRAYASSLGLLYQPGRETLVSDLLEDPTIPWLQASARAAKLRGRLDKLKGREKRLRKEKT